MPLSGRSVCRSGNTYGEAIAEEELSELVSSATAQNQADTATEVVSLEAGTEDCLKNDDIGSSFSGWRRMTIFRR